MDKGTDTGGGAAGTVNSGRDGGERQANPDISTSMPGWYYSGQKRCKFPASAYRYIQPGHPPEQQQVWNQLPHGARNMYVTASDIMRAIDASQLGGVEGSVSGTPSAGANEFDYMDA